MYLLICQERCFPFRGRMWKLKQRLRNHCHFSKVLALKYDGEFTVWRHLLVLCLRNKREKKISFMKQQCVSVLCKQLLGLIYISPERFRSCPSLLIVKSKNLHLSLRKPTVCALNSRHCARLNITKVYCLQMPGKYISKHNNKATNTTIF